MALPSANAGASGECVFDALDDSYSTPAGVAVDVEAPGVLANDVGCGYELAAALLGQPANGVAQWGGSGNFIYTPNAGFTGTDTFSYRFYIVENGGGFPPIVDNEYIDAVVSIEVLAPTAPTSAPTTSPVTDPPATNAPATTILAGSGATLPETGSANAAVALLAAAACALGAVLVGPARRQRQQRS